MNNPYAPPQTLSSAPLDSQSILFSYEADLHSGSRAEASRLWRVSCGLLLRRSLPLCLVLTFLVPIVWLTTSSLDVWLIFQVASFMFYMVLLNVQALLRIRNSLLKAINPMIHGRIILVGREHTFTLITADQELSGAWQLVQSISESGDVIFFECITSMNRHGLYLKTSQSTALYQAILSRLFHPRAFSSDLIEMAAPGSIQMQEPIQKVSGTITADSMSKRAPELWRQNQFQTLSLTICVAMLLFGGIAAFANLLSDWGAALATRAFDLISIAIAVMILWNQFKYRFVLVQGLIQTFSPRSVISQLEYRVSSEGIESHTNASFVRTRWSFYRDPEVLDGQLLATCQASGVRDSVIQEVQFSNPEDWDAICQTAIRYIPRSALID